MIDTCSSEHRIFTPLADVPIMWFMAIMLPFIIVFGLIGNSLSFVILKKGSNKVSSLFYIRCLTIFDNFSLIFSFTGFYLALVLHPILMIYSPSYRPYGDIWVRWGSCQSRTYLAFTARTLSIYTIVIFTMERTIAIRKPFFSLHYCTVKTAKILIGSLIILALLGNLVWVFSFERKTAASGVTICKASDNMLPYRALDFIFLAILPSFVIVICNFIILYTLYKRKQLVLLAPGESKSKCKRDRKVTIQLLAISFTFVILCVPSCVSSIINSYFENLKHKDYRCGNLANLFHITFWLLTVQFAINFLLYCFIGKHFRYAAWNMLICRFKLMKRHQRALFETVTKSNETKLSVINQNEKSNIDNSNFNRDHSRKKLLNKSESNKSEKL